jgi:L-threonylcarbamoyladenylate synthase
VARDLLDAFGAPISAPSANRTGRVSPTDARHVAQDFSNEDDLLILDGGPCEVGLESTVLDLTGPVPSILRAGSVTLRELTAVLGTVDRIDPRRQMQSPGTTPRHYAPRTPAELVESAALVERLGSLDDHCAVLCFDTSAVPPPHRALLMPQGAGDYARMLYGTLRRADELGVDRIVIETPPSTNEVWLAVIDRLRRATTPAS